MSYMDIFRCWSLILLISINDTVSRSVRNAPEEGNICESLGSEIQQCLQSFEMHLIRYREQGIGEGEKQGMVPALCDAYGRSLQCLHILLSKCPPTSFHLQLIEERIGSERQAMALTCFSPPSVRSHIEKKSTTSTTTTVPTTTVPRRIFHNTEWSDNHKNTEHIRDQLNIKVTTTTTRSSVETKSSSNQANHDSEQDYVTEHIQNTHKDTYYVTEKVKNSEDLSENKSDSKSSEFVGQHEMSNNFDANSETVHSSEHTDTFNHSDNSQNSEYSSSNLAYNNEFQNSETNNQSNEEVNNETGQFADHDMKGAEKAEIKSGSEGANPGCEGLECFSNIFAHSDSSSVHVSQTVLLLHLCFAFICLR